MRKTTLSDDFRWYVRNQLGRFTLAGRTRRDLAIRPDRDVCIEGYPRSANTYAVLLVERFAVRPLSIAHHLHISVQLKRAVKHRIPAVLLIREPLGAVSSLLLREETVSPYNALRWYNTFHADLLPVRSQLIVWPFEMATQQPLDSIRMLSERTGLVAVEGSAELRNEDIFAEIDALDKKYKQGSALSHVNSRPNAGKQADKATMADALHRHPRFARMLREAQSHYKTFMALAAKPLVTK